MKRKRLSRQKGKKRPSPPENKGFHVFEHPYSKIDKDVLREILLTKGRESGERFPKLLESIAGRFHRWHPLHIIATIASYGLQVGVTDKGASSDGMLKDMQQHHIEMLQALALTLPYAEWGDAPAPPQVIQEVIDETKEFTEAFRNRRLVAIEEGRDDQQRVVLALQERLREHTQVVRNWGHFSAVVRISKELYCALDQDLLDHFGFSASDLIDVSNALLTAYQARANARFTLLREIFRARTTETLVRDFYAKYPGVTGDSEEFLAHIPAGVTTEMVGYRLLAHADIALVKLGIADVDELATLSARPPEVVERVLARLSIAPGELDATKAESFFLSNPVWTAPGLHIRGEYYFPAPQAIFSHVFSIMNALARDAGLKDKLEKRRAAFLEDKVGEIVGAALPAAKISKNVKWKSDGNLYETDLLCLFDRVALIVEAKSAALTPQGLRGAPDRIKRHVRDLVVAPAEQSYRLEQIIAQAKSGDPVSREIVSGLGLDADDVDTVIRISVTLDDFSTLCSAEKQLKAANWAPADLRLAPTMNLADFEVVSEILDEPAHFLHYLTERERVQKHIEIFGDELDYLGFYLETGFNVAALYEGGAALVITGMSRSIDHYYASLDAGVQVPKPEPKIHSRLKRIVREIRRRNAKRWTTMALGLLSMGSVEEQRRIFAELDKLKWSVCKAYRDPEHPCSLVISPPSHCAAYIIFYVYPDALSSRRHDTVSHLAAKAFEQRARERCIVIGKKVEDWERPYQYVGIATPPQ
ncbi:hypothetical protein [Stenotrophomonas mori]|uniref:NERD domain-containing protein n=1 Tax=Stenotrophomonas mori TaxID=2871096 RepID=A0ABT0SFG6_9GAMM|nr:hypothetical protein [Stenotrophomonas mori]MCL7714070.1 hypothetical protein [Stenotrophomonas mori]